MQIISLEEIERQARRLPYDQKLLLIERLISAIRKGSQPKALTLEDQLAAMAADPDIQQEIQAINTEFSIAESDGLE